MERLASGPKDHYYGKGDVIVYRLNRDGRVAAGRSPVFGANVLMLIYGDAFWPTYTTGDNTGLIATDSMKNFIQRETLNFTAIDLEDYCRFLGREVSRHVSAGRGRAGLGAPRFRTRDSRAASRSCPPARSGRPRAIELTRDGRRRSACRASAASGCCAWAAAPSMASCAIEYTTLPDLHNRPLHMWLDLEWRYTGSDAAFNDGDVTAPSAADRA